MVHGGDRDVHGILSRPLARCIVATGTDPDTPPDPSSSCTGRMPAARTAESARSICSCDLTNTPIACGA